MKNLEFSTPEQLSKFWRKKVIAIGLLFGMTLPLVVLELIGYPHDKGYIQNYLYYVLILSGLTIFSVYGWFFHQHNCPECKHAWTYSVVKAELLSSVVWFRYKVGITYRVIRNFVLNEYKCSHCGYENVKQVTRNSVEKENATI